MQKYYIRIGGGVSVRQVEFVEEFPSDSMATGYLERSLRYYYPVYFEASLERITGPEGKETFTRVADFKMRKVVEVTKVEAEEPSNG